MLKKKLFALPILCIGFLLLLFGCGSDNGESANDQEKEKVRMAVIPNAPPFMYMEDGELTGFEVELVYAIAEEENLEVEWNEMKFDPMIPAMEANQIDGAIAAFFVTEERKKVIDYTEPYFEQGMVVAVPEDSDIQSFEDFEGKTIVAKQGSAGLESAKKFADEYGAEVSILQDEATIYIEVEVGQADGVIHDSTVIAYKIAQDRDSGNEEVLRIVGDMFDSSDTAIAFQKDSKFVEIFNSGLEKVKESGKFDEIYGKYFAD